MKMRFEAIDEPLPGRASRAWMDRTGPRVRDWYRGAVDAGYELPAPESCRRRIATAMPEVLPGYDAAVALAPDDPIEAAAIAEVDPPPFIPAGCTVRALAAPTPTVVRNYDFHPDATSGVVVRSRWRERRVMGMGEGIIGLLDGVNDAGLVGAITFGGRPVHGRGFGVPLILRWLLEVADDVATACEAVATVRCAWAQNILLADAGGHTAVVHLSPDRDTEVTAASAVTNHHAVTEASASSRERLIVAQGIDGDAAQAVSAFHSPPLFGRSLGDWLATLYTAVYDPTSRGLALHWPGQPAWRLGLDAFEPGAREVKIAAS